MTGVQTCALPICFPVTIDGAYGIYIDNSVTTVSKNARIDMLHAEIGSSGVYANAIIGVNGSDPFTMKATEVFWQGGSNVILMESTKITNAVKVTNATQNTIEDAKNINKKIQGIRITPKNNANFSQIINYCKSYNNAYRDWETDRKSTRLNSSHRSLSRMPSSA